MSEEQMGVRAIREQQHQLSALLSRSLFEILGTFRLDFHYDELAPDLSKDSCLSAYLPKEEAGKRKCITLTHDVQLYKIYPQEQINKFNTSRLGLLVQDGTRSLINFNSDEYNRTFFKFDGYDYLEILQELSILFAQDEQRKYKPFMVSYELGVKGESEDKYKIKLKEYEDSLQNPTGKRATKVLTLPDHIRKALNKLSEKTVDPDLVLKLETDSDRVFDEVKAWDYYHMSALMYIKSLMKSNRKR